jgi:hypothetical protein
MNNNNNNGATQIISLLEEKLIKKNLGLAVLNTRVTRWNIVIPTFYIRNLYSSYVSSNL